MNRRSNNMYPGDIKRICGFLTTKQLQKLPAGIQRVQGALGLSRTEVLEKEKLIPSQTIVLEKNKKSRFDKLEVKRLKRELKPFKNKVIIHHC